MGCPENTRSKLRKDTRTVDSNYLATGKIREIRFSLKKFSVIK